MTDEIPSEDVPQPQEEQPPAPPEPATFTDLVEAADTSPIANEDITEVRVAIRAGNLGEGFLVIGSCEVDENGVMTLVAIFPNSGLS